MFLKQLYPTLRPPSLPNDLGTWWRTRRWVRASTNSAVQIPTTTNSISLSELLRCCPDCDLRTGRDSSSSIPNPGQSIWKNRWPECAASGWWSAPVSTTAFTTPKWILWSKSRHPTDPKCHRLIIGLIPFRFRPTFYRHPFFRPIRRLCRPDHRHCRQVSPDPRHKKLILVSVNSS